MEKLLSVVPTQNFASMPLVNLAATPPVSASAVGRAAVAAATDPAVLPGEPLLPAASLWLQMQTADGLCV